MKRSCGESELFRCGHCDYSMELFLLWLLSLWTRCGSAQEMKPRPVNVSEGDDARLPCVHSSGHRVDGFDWRKNIGDDKKITVFEYPRGRRVIDPAFTGRVKYDPEKLASGDASIIIKNTDLKDNGTYTCGLGLERTNRQEIHITLNVECRSLKIRNGSGAPKPDIDDVLPFGDRGPWKLLKCTAHGDPEPELKWLNSAGVELKKIVPQSQSGHSDVELLLNVTKTDSYTCVATQEKICHQISNTREVTIPEFVAGSEGDDAVLSCTLDSNENFEGLKFYWTKDYKEFFSYNSGQENIQKQFKGRLEYYEDKLKFGNASIKIQRTQRSDSGRYSCIFQNVQKSHIILDIEKSGWSPSVVVPVFVVVVLVIALPLLAIIAFLVYKNRSQTGRANAHPQNGSTVGSSLLNT